MDSNSTVAPSPLFLKFANYGVITEAIPCIVIYMILVFLGLYGNFTVAITTYRFKQFHGTCGVLLSVGAVGDSFHQLSHFFFWYLIFTGKTFTDLRTCVIVNTVPIIGLNFGLFMTFFIAIDRLFSILSPGKHRVINKYVYVGLILALILAFDIFCFVQIYENMNVTPTFQTTCLIIDAMPGGIGQTWFSVCLITNVATIVSYAVVWLAIKLKTTTSESTKRIFKSLVIIAGTVFFGWAINACIQVTLRAFQVDPVQSWFIGLYAGLPVNTACACNYFVLYFFSKDYKTAFRRQINSISKAFLGKSVIRIEGDVTIQPMTVTLSSRK